jgi:hypothetical protein
LERGKASANVVLAIGSLVVVVGLAKGTVPTIVIGSVLILAGAFGPGARRIAINLLGSGMIVDRDEISQAVREQAGARGLDQPEARAVEREATASVPEAGSPVQRLSSSVISTPVAGKTVILIEIKGDAPIAEQVAEQLALATLNEHERRKNAAMDAWAGADAPPGETFHTLHPSKRSSKAFSTEPLPVPESALLWQAIAEQAQAGKRLLVYAVGSKSALKTISLDPGTTVSLGRAAECDHVFPDLSVSARQAQISVAEDGTSAEIKDLDSSYGTFLDGVRVNSAELRHEGVIEFSMYTLLHVAPHQRLGEFPFKLDRSG